MRHERRRHVLARRGFALGAGLCARRGSPDPADTVDLQVSSTGERPSVIPLWQGQETLPQRVRPCHNADPATVPSVGQAATISPRMLMFNLGAPIGILRVNPSSSPDDMRGASDLPTGPNVRELCLFDATEVVERACGSRAGMGPKRATRIPHAERALIDAPARFLVGSSRAAIRGGNAWTT